MRSAYLVAAGEGEGSPVAHAVPDMGSITATHGMALCSYPADHLAVIPGLKWDAVNTDSRCALCEEERIRVTVPDHAAT